MKHFIYILVDPRDNQPRYVGKTVNVKRRYDTEFLREINSPHDTHKTRWIRSLAAIGLLPELEVVREVDPQYLCETEKFCIEEYRRLGCDLTNTAEGGKGGNTGNYRLPGIEAARRAKLKRRQSKLKGRKQDPEFVARRVAKVDYAKMAETLRKHNERKRFYEKLFGVERPEAWNKGVSLNEETKKKISESVKAEYAALSEEERKARHANNAFHRIHEEVKAGLRDHPAKGHTAWNKGKEMGTEIIEKAWETRRANGFKSQKEYIQMIANHCGESEAKTARALKGYADKVKPESVEKIWAAYYELGEAVSGLKVVASTSHKVV